MTLEEKLRLLLVWAEESRSACQRQADSYEYVNEIEAGYRAGAAAYQLVSEKLREILEH